MEKYSGSTLEKCLMEASKKLNIPLDNLEYEVIKESKGLFKKNVTIRVKNKANILSDEINKSQQVEKKRRTNKDSRRKNPNYRCKRRWKAC